MLELELVMTEESNVYLSKKSIFVESILYNVPNKFFENNDFSKMFSDVVNYLKQCNVEDFKTIDNTLNQKLFTKNGYYANSYFSSFLRKILYINTNANEMIDTAIKVAQNSQTNTKIETNNNYSEKVKKINKK